MSYYNNGNLDSSFTSFIRFGLGSNAELQDSCSLLFFTSYLAVIITNMETTRAMPVLRNVIRTTEFCEMYEFFKFKLLSRCFDV
jgi:hypothetical protein